MRSAFKNYTNLVTINDEAVDSPMKNEHLVCYLYNKGSCQSPHVCQRFHFCCAWLFGTCKKIFCFYEHSIKNRANEDFMKLLGITGWTETDLKLLVLAMEKPTSDICPLYNSIGNSCDHSTISCANFHVCFTYLEKGMCTGPCGLNHRINQCENQKIILEANGLGADDIFDEVGQLRARLSLGLSSLPHSASYQAIVLAKLMCNNSSNTVKLLAHPKTAYAL